MIKEFNDKLYGGVDSLVKDKITDVSALFLGIWIGVTIAAFPFLHPLLWSVLGLQIIFLGYTFWKRKEVIWDDDPIKDMGQEGIIKID